MPKLRLTTADSEIRAHPWLKEFGAWLPFIVSNALRLRVFALKPVSRDSYISRLKIRVYPWLNRPMPKSWAFKRADPAPDRARCRQGIGVMAGNYLMTI